MIRVFIVDDEVLVRRAITVMLSAAPDLLVVGEASDGAAAVRRCDVLSQSAGLRPDVVLMDIKMPVLDGIAATSALTREHPELRVIIVTTFGSEHSIVPALRAGAAGYVVKDAEPGELFAAIRDVRAGELALSKHVTRGLVDALRADSAIPRSPEPEHIDHLLSEREVNVVRLLGEGLSNAEIAGRLHLSEATVKTHMGRVMSKWGVRDRVQVLIRAVSMSLVKL